MSEPVSLKVGRVAAPLREQVLAVLRRAIVEQQLPPGHRLIERELIDQTGVSRTTIREVLRELAAEGLVRTVPQKGAVVAVPTAQEAAELYEVRAALEALAARRFVVHASAAQVEELRVALGELERVTVDGGDIRAMLEAKDRFYDVLLRGCGNRAVHDILSGLKARVALLRTSSLSQPGRPARSVGEIRAIVEAVEARDAEAAARACAHHVEQAARAGLEGRA
jgi:DNA-binding GntR family transcriptional regulator